MSALAPEISRLVLGPLQTNCYLVVCPTTRAALLIDPADEAPRILDAAKRESARIEQILLTHTHPDHVGALPAVRRDTGARVLAHRLDVEMLRNSGRFFGISADQAAQMIPDVQLEGGEEISIGDLKGTLIHTPGHSAGSLSLQVGKVLFTGDTLFAQGIGRVDLPTGNLDSILASIQTLFTYPDDYKVYPGHGPSTTIGIEKVENPYV